MEERSALLLLPGCLIAEWSLGRGAAIVGWLQVTRKINIGMMIFVAAMFGANEEEECPLDFLCKYEEHSYVSWQTFVGGPAFGVGSLLA